MINIVLIIVAACFFFEDMQAAARVVWPFVIGAALGWTAVQILLDFL